jgi:hypothetical protein
VILSEIAAKLGLKVLNPGAGLGDEVTIGYASDMLSDAMGHAPPGAIWITIQAHPNVIAVASLLSLAGIVFPAGAHPDETTIRKAADEQITLLSTDLPKFEVVGGLYSLGIRGARRG